MSFGGTSPREQRNSRQSHRCGGLRRPLSIETLEPRLLLSATLDDMSGGGSGGFPATRHQIFKSESDANQAGQQFTDEIGLRYYYGASRTTNPFASDGRVVYLRDSIQWALTDTSSLNPEANPARQGRTGFKHAYDNELRYLFRGSGVDLLYVRDAAGETLRWEVIVGGQQGAFQVVASGQIDTNDQGLGGSLQTQSLAAAGTLDIENLYILRVWAIDSDGSTVRNAVFLDAIDIYDEQAFSTDDNANSSGNWSYSATWTPSQNLADPLAIGGGRAAESIHAASITYTFEGSSLAIFGYGEAGVNGAYDWKIDGGGPGLQGTVDQTLDSDFAIRWVEVLVNGLAAGSHTLTITTKNPGNRGVVGDLGPKPHQGFAQIDAIATKSEPVEPEPDFWADTRGVYVFNAYHAVGPWSSKDWTLPQWEIWLDTMQFMNLNHVQLLRAPWTERPAQTPEELAKEELWIDVLQSAKARGMKTSLVFGSTWHGDFEYPWKILSPGNSTADPNYQQLVLDYQYFANRYGQWVDEWYMGMEDPGGSPSSAGLPYSFETPSPLGNSSTVAQFVSLALEMRSLARQVNPNSTVHIAATGMHWWGLSPGYANQFQQFMASVPSLPSDIQLSHWGFEDAQIDQMQATGRDVDAWPFYLFDHEFPIGHTKLHFQLLQQNLEKIRLQGIDDVTPHIAHPIEQLPSLYVYSRLLEDTTLSEQVLLQEFASFLVADASDQVRLASAIQNLGKYWNATTGVANWDLSQLQPVQATAPYSPRYSATILGYLDQALADINAVDSPRAVAQMPMLVSASEWVDMLRTQIVLLQKSARIGSLVAAGNAYLDSQYGSVNATPTPLTRAAAEAIVEAANAAGAGGVIDALHDYLAKFWPIVVNQNHPLGIIFDFLSTKIPTVKDGTAVVSGDFLEFDAPSFPLLLKQLEGLTQESDSSFSYRDSSVWTQDVSAAYSGGTAMIASATGSEINIIFAGTGISLVHSLWSGGGNAAWSIDAGAGGSGTINMNAATRQDQVKTLLATGLSPTLHVLRIRDLGSGVGDSIMIDAVETVANIRLRREDTRSAFTYGGSWTTTEEGTPSGGSWRYTTQSGASVTIPFNGPAVAVAVTTRVGYGTFNWSIDGGAGGSGTINLTSSTYTFGRQFILSRSLSDGPHTLVLTNSSNALVGFDAVDTIVTSFGSGSAGLESAATDGAAAFAGFGSIEFEVQTGRSVSRATSDSRTIVSADELQRVRQEALLALYSGESNDFRCADGELDGIGIDRLQDTIVTDDFDWSQFGLDRRLGEGGTLTTETPTAAN